MSVNLNMRLIFFITLLSLGKLAQGQWVRISDLPNSTFLDLYFIDDTIGFTIGHEFIYKTIDGGYTWQSTQLGETTDIVYEFDFINRDTGFIVGDVSGSRAFYTYDMGETWVNFGPYAYATRIAIINSNEFMWCEGGYHEIHRYNVSMGMEISIDPGIIALDVEVFSEDTIYVGGGGFSRSFDRGENWEIIETPGISWMDFANSRVGYSSSNEYFKTIDYGETWTEIDIPFFFDGCSSPEIVSDLIGYFPCAYDGAFDYHGIMKTIDGGESWIYNESIPPLFDDDAIGKIFCLNKDTCWCVTYTGQVYYTSNGGGETQPPVSIKENLPKNISISPNPFEDTFTLQVNESNGLSEITIVNTTGECIPFNVISNNESQKVINIKNAPSGIYLIKFGNNSEKIIKL